MWARGWSEKVIFLDIFVRPRIKIWSGGNSFLAGKRSSCYVDIFRKVSHKLSPAFVRWSENNWATSVFGMSQRFLSLVFTQKTTHRCNFQTRAMQQQTNAKTRELQFAGRFNSVIKCEKLCIQTLTTDSPESLNRKQICDVDTTEQKYEYKKHPKEIYDRIWKYLNTNYKTSQFQTNCSGSKYRRKIFKTDCQQKQISVRSMTKPLPSSTFLCSARLTNFYHRLQWSEDEVWTHSCFHDAPTLCHCKNNLQTRACSSFVMWWKLLLNQGRCEICKLPNPWFCTTKGKERSLHWIVGRPDIANSEQPVEGMSSDMHTT